MKNKLSTNFNSDLIPALNEVAEFAYKNKHSDFYKKKYNQETFPNKISSYEEFIKIPFLKKEEFLDLPLEEITFVPEEEILFYSSSGGSTTGKPTILPVSDYGFEEIKKNYFNEDFFKQLGINTIITLLQPSSSPLLRCMRLPDRQTNIIPGDIHNLPLMAKVAQQIGIQGVIATNSRLNEFVDCLEKVGFDFKQIKWISTGSEFCPTGIIKKYKSKMPNAYINIRCGNSDIGGSRGYRCQYLAEKIDSPELFHPTKPLIEIVDNNGNTLPMGEFGEIVHTDIKKKAFPVIRYKTGDIGMLTEEKCPCGNDLLLTFEGKKETDFVAIPGGHILRSRSIASAIYLINEYVDSRFQLHIYNSPNSGILSLVLNLKLNEKYKLNQTDEKFIKMLSDKIISNIQISPGIQLSNLIENSIIDFNLGLIPKWEYDFRKFKHIIIHKEYKGD